MVGLKKQYWVFSKFKCFWNFMPVRFLLMPIVIDQQRERTFIKFSVNHILTVGCFFPIFWYLKNCNCLKAKTNKNCQEQFRSLLNQTNRFGRRLHKSAKSRNANEVEISQISSMDFNQILVKIERFMTKPSSKRKFPFVNKLKYIKINTIHIHFWVVSFRNWIILLVA